MLQIIPQLFAKPRQNDKEALLHKLRKLENAQRSHHRNHRFDMRLQVEINKTANELTSIEKAEHDYENEVAEIVADLEKESIL